MIDVQWKLLCSWRFLSDVYGNRNGFVRLLGKQEWVGDWHVQDSQAKDTDETNFLPLTDVEYPDE